MGQGSNEYAEGEGRRVSGAGEGATGYGEEGGGRREGKDMAEERAHLPAGGEHLLLVESRVLDSQRLELLDISCRLGQLELERVQPLTP